MEQANLKRNRGKKLKFSIDTRELVLVWGGFVAGVGLASLIRDHIRERKQRKPFNDGTTTQPNSENEDSQGLRSPIAPEENLNCSPIRVRPTDQEGSEAGQPTPTSTNMDSDPRTGDLPAGYNQSETPDSNGAILYRDFVGPGNLQNTPLVMTGNPAYYALLMQPNMACLQAWSAPIDGHTETQIPNESLNFYYGDGDGDEDGGCMLMESGKNFYDVFYFVAHSLNSGRLMILIVMGMLMILALAYLVYRVAMAYIRICSPCDLHYM